MIIKALCDLSGKLALSESGYPEFGRSRINNADTVICISADGKLERIISLVRERMDEKGKTRQELPFKIVPFQHTRSSGISPYFLCDTPEYILGIKHVPKKKTARDKLNESAGHTDWITAMDKFNESAGLHRKILGGLNTPCALGILSFFNTWVPEKAFDNPLILEYLKLFKGRILFMVETADPLNDSEIWRCWQEYYDKTLGESKLCSVLGLNLPAARLHSKIKNVYNGSGTGASLVSFNNPAFESYGLKGNDNACISEQAAFAYSSALNYLLSNRSTKFLMGKSTFVCWADSGDDSYSKFISDILNTGSSTMDEERLLLIMDRIRRGLCIEFEEKNLDPDSDFYILGMSPNKGRLAITYYCHNSFGSLLKNITSHYDRLSVIGSHRVIGPSCVLYELMINKNDTIPDWLSSDFLSSILNDTRYPFAIYHGILARIYSDGKINQTRVAMIKAFLLKNSINNKIKEVLLMELNNSSDYQPYVLGRLFAVLERVQRAAIGTSTIKDKFFDSACATPAVAFPSILLLSNKHLKKLENDNKKKGLAIYFQRNIDELISMLYETFPTHLSIEEQGAFIIGYYHQNNAMNKKKEVADEDN